MTTKQTKTEPHVNNIYSMFEIVPVQDVLYVQIICFQYSSYIHNTVSFLNRILRQMFILNIRHNFMF